MCESCAVAIKICNNCGEESYEGECGCPPEGYVRPGTESFLYVNAYEVSRHYGGPAEGGWWYNHYEPIASIPVKAVSTAGHSAGCHTCSCARLGLSDSETGEKYELCRWGFELEAIDPEQVEMFARHLEDLYGDRREGSIYSVRGGLDIHVVVEDSVGERTPRPIYC